MVDRGEATVTDIDLSMQLGAGHPMGPLHLADYIGNQPVQCRVVSCSAAQCSAVHFWN